MAERKSKKTIKSQQGRKPSELMDIIERRRMPQLVRMVDLLDEQRFKARLGFDRRLYGDVITTLLAARDLLDAIAEGDISEYERCKENLHDYMQFQPPELGGEI